MNEFLEKNGYLYVEQFLSEIELESLNSAFNSAIDSYKFSEKERYKHLKINNPGDVYHNFEEKPDDSASVYLAIRNFVPFVALQCKKIHEISSLIGDDVIPTYNLARKYLNGAQLIEHSDRDVCEISLTINLSYDKQWGFCIQKPETNEYCNISQNPGDAVIYLGTKCNHWREGKFTGEYYSQLFLHYVKAKGENAYLYFDLLGGRTTNFLLQKKMFANRNRN